VGPFSPNHKAHEYYQLDLAIGRTEGNRHLAAVLAGALERWEEKPGLAR